MDSTLIETTLEFNIIEEGGNSAANCLGIDEIPFAGSVLSPRARHLRMKSNSLDVVSKFLSKNIPPKKGRKKRSIIESVKPIFWSKFKVDVSLAEKISLSDWVKTLILVNAMSNLSGTVPIGLVRVWRESQKCRIGSATVWKRPS